MWNRIQVVYELGIRGGRVNKPPWPVRPAKTFSALVSNLESSFRLHLKTSSIRDCYRASLHSLSRSDARPDLHDIIMQHR